MTQKEISIMPPITEDNQPELSLNWERKKGNESALYKTNKYQI